MDYIMDLPVLAKEPSMTQKKIKENTCLTYIPSEKFKTSFFSAQLIVPLDKKTAGLNALLVNVLSRGTLRCPNMSAIGRELDMLYGARLEPTVRKKGETQMFGFIASCVDDRFLPPGQHLMEKMTDLLGEFWCDPITRGGRLLEEYVDSERENLVDLIRSDINDKRAYAARRLMEEMCSEEPYGVARMGSAQDVERISLRKLNEHYKALLPEARLELFYCGSAPEKRVAGAFTRAFASLPRKGEALPSPTTRRPAPDVCRVVKEEMDVTQGKLCLGFRTDSSDIPATMLMNTMFGGSSNSKLFLNVREKLSLCYYAGSTYHRQKGIITVSSGIGSGSYDRAVEEIFAQLEAIRRGNWEDWELESSRQSLLSNLRSMEDSAGALEDYVLGQAAVGGDETLEGLSAALREVTPQRIQDAAAAVKPDTIYFLKGKEADE